MKILVGTGAVVACQRKHTHHEQVALLDEGHEWRRKVGAIGGNEHVDFVDVDKL